MQSDLHLINLPRKYAGDDITCSSFSDKLCLVSFINLSCFDYVRGRTRTVHNESSVFLIERSFISGDAMSRSGKYTDLCHYDAHFSEGMLFKFTFCSNERF